jgi:hypothetical protein
MNNVTDRHVSNGHTTNGKFAPGNRCSPGNPNALKMHRLRAALLDATTPEQVAAVIKKLAEQAAAGDVPSAKVFLDHVVGRPLQAIEVSGLGGVDTDLSRLRTAILAALADEPTARSKVARALLTIGDEGNGPGSSAGTGA